MQRARLPESLVSCDTNGCGGLEFRSYTSAKLGCLNSKPKPQSLNLSLVGKKHLQLKPSHQCKFRAGATPPFLCRMEDAGVSWSTPRLSLAGGDACNARLIFRYIPKIPEIVSLRNAGNNGIVCRCPLAPCQLPSCLRCRWAAQARWPTGLC